MAKVGCCLRALGARIHRPFEASRCISREARLTSAVVSVSNSACAVSDDCSSLRQPFHVGHCWFCVSEVPYCGMLGDLVLPDQQMSFVVVIQMTAELCLQLDGPKNLSFATSLVLHLTTYWLSGSCESHRAFQSVFLGTTIQLHPKVLLFPLYTDYETMTGRKVARLGGRGACVV